MIKPGQYYVCYEGGDNYVEGELYLVSAFYGNEVKFEGGETTYTDSTEAFLAHCKHDPEGFQKKNERINQLLREMDDFEAQQNQLSLEMSLPEAAPSSETALVKGDSFKLQKKKLAEMTAKIHHMNTAMEKKREELTSLLEEKKAILDRKLHAITKLAGRLKEGIYTVNLYLGVEEEILQLRDGVPAPATEKVKIRQQVLYMDEECAVRANQGGIDFSSVMEFDKWILKSKKNLDQLLPENKGIVALQIRREAKHYSDDIWLQAELEKRDRTTYLLIRNGEKLYRICPDIHIMGHMFPLQDEFDDFFYTSDHWSREEPKLLRPGTEAYMQSMESADAHRRHYLRILLILQGLFDRTDVFQPIEGDRVNICDRREARDVLEFIRDAEMALPDGRERFRDWLKRINSQLAVGHRIIGRFDDYNVDMDDRLTPRRAHRPDADTIYVIEGRSNDAFVIRYKRGETIFTRYEHHDAKVRASCLIYTTDDFLLNVDVAEIDEMQFYLESRLDRYNYLRMIPLLETAINLKKEEQKTEKPFCDLLTGAIMKKHGLTEEAARKAIAELVIWWKFKNKTHRALTSNDKLAYQQILAEFGFRQEQELERQKRSKASQHIVDAIKAIKNRVVYVGHKKKNEYVSYQAHNDQDIFLCETCWKYNGNTKEVRETKERAWILLDRRFERWECIFKEERWDSWRKDIRMNEVLMDPEIQYILGRAPSELRGKVSSYDDEEGKPKYRFLPIAITYDPKNCMYQIWFTRHQPLLPVKNLCTDPIREVDFCGSVIQWKRKGSGELLISFDWPSQYSGDKPWDDRWRHPLIVWMNKDNYDQVIKENEQVEKAKEKRKELRDKAHDLSHQISKILWEDKLAELYTKFTEDNHPSMWPQFKEKLKTYDHCPLMHSCWTQDMIGLLLGQNIEVIGKDFGWIIDKAAELGYKPDPDEKKLVEEVEEGYMARIRQIVFEPIAEPAEVEE